MGSIPFHWEKRSKPLDRERLETDRSERGTFGSVVSLDLNYGRVAELVS